MNVLQPAIDGQITAGQDWLEFRLDGASWIEGGQMWVLEVEPVGSFPSTNELEEPQSATTRGLKYPSAQSKQTPETGLAIQEYQHESDKIKSPAPGHLRAQKTFRGNGKAFGHSLKRSVCQRSRPEKLVRCDQCEKTFRYPSDLARHRGHRHKAAKEDWSQSETDSPTLSESTLLALRRENTLTQSSKASHQSSEAMTGQDARPRKQFFCNECGKAFRCPSHVARHQHVHSKQKTAKAAQSASGTNNPSLRELPPLENTSINYNEAPSQNSKVTAKQNRDHRRRNFCKQCEKGFRYPSDLARHHRRRHKVAKKEQSQSETDSPTFSESALLVLQRENTFTKSSKASHQNSEATTGQNACPRKQFFCNECGKAFRCPLDVARHQSVHTRQKTIKAAQSALEIDNCSPQEFTPLAAPVENTSINYSEAPSQNSKVTTKQNRDHRRRYFCKQCEKGFRYPSDLARHHRRRHKVAKQDHSQSETDSPSFSESALLALQRENTFTKSSKASHQNSEATIGQSARPRKQLFCNECGKAFRYPSHVARHQRVHTKQKTAKTAQSASGTDNSSPREFPPLATPGENTSINYSKAPSQNAKVTTKQNRDHRRWYFCKQCEKGFRYPSDLARHQRVHSRHKAAERSPSQSEVDSSSSSESPQLALQRENVFTKARKAFHQNSKAATDQMENISVNSSETLSQNSMLTTNRSPRHRKRRFCHECGESWTHHAHSGQEAAKRAPSEAENSSPSDLTSLMKLLDNISLSSSGALRQNSKGTTRQSSRCRRRCFSGPCGDLCRRLSDLAWHPRANSEQRAAKPPQSPSEASSPSVAGQAENAFANSSQTLAKKAKTATKPSVPQRRDKFCGQCGKAFQYPSHLARHQAVHSRQKGNLSPWEADSPTSLGPTSVEPRAESPRTNFSKVLHQSSTVTTDQRFQGSKRWFCAQCGKVFRCRSDLARHKRVHSKRRAAVPLPKGLQKENAAATVSDTNSPSSMCATARNSPATKPYLCDQCGEGFWWRSELTQHEYSHFHERPYYCSICGHQFRRRVQLVKHQRWHEGGRGGEGEGEMFQNVDTDDSAGRYLPREVLQALSPETIGELGEMFVSPEGCEAGARDAGVKDASRIHPANSIWEIGISGQPYLLSLPRAGERGCCETDGEGGSSTRPPEPSLQVEDVSGTVSEPTASSSEVSTTMATVPVASPGACGLVASEPEEETSTANVSIDRVAWRPQTNSADTEWFVSTNRPKPLHEQARSSVRGAGPHSCLICSKRFKCAGYLTRHLNIHQTGKPHGCTLCEMTFGRRSYLLKHLKRRHRAVVPHLPSMPSARVLKEKPSSASVTVGRPPQISSPDPEWLPSQQRPRQPRKRDRLPAQGAEPHSCPICSKCFKCAEYLAKHLKIHRPGNAHSCTLCEKKFGQRSYLLKHCRNMHGTHLRKKT